MTNNNEKAHNEAKKKVKKLKKFYVKLISYIVINTGLFLINLLTFNGYWWFLWVTVFWGIGLIIGYIKQFKFDIFGKKWEEKKIKEYMEKE
ncbi:MAG: 2TM domain-containing protein [Methanobrevibacter sp.]|nr:2TM domain-containing protein [Methanobrevibacter sp.]